MQPSPEQPQSLPTPPPEWDDLRSGPMIVPEEESLTGRWLGWLIVSGVMGIASCMCATITLLSGFAGVRDEYNAISTEAVGTQQAAVATQYFRANNEIDQGLLELAADRLEFVETTVPGYLDAAQQLADLRLQLSATPTPAATETPQMTPTPPQSATEVIQAEPTDPFAPESLYAQGEAALNVSLYEEAIDWFEALRQIDPNYRRAEVQAALVDAYVRQGSSYLRGANSDGEDRLATGVQYILRASELGYTGQFVTEAEFVELYLTVRSYLDAGLTEQVGPLLTRLCEINCSWSNTRDAYPSIEGLIQRYGGG